MSRHSGVFLTLVLSLGRCGDVLPAWASEGPNAKQIAAIFAPLVSRQEPGLAVLVRLNGKTLFRTSSPLLLAPHFRTDLRF